jgi:hypothetical protein
MKPGFKKSSLPAQVFRKKAKRQILLRRDIDLRWLSSLPGKEAAWVVIRSVGPGTTGPIM